MARVTSFVAAWIAALSAVASAQDALSTAGALASVAPADASNATTAALSAVKTVASAAAKWLFTPVTSVQVRVQGNLPVWDAKNKVYVASYGNTFDEKYRSVLDTVNMAAVEGAFKYAQAECINQDVVVNCTRKNDIKYVVFYQTTIVQPRAAMAFYQLDTTGKAAIEHCPFIPMDGGQCTPTNGVLPKECDQFFGLNGQEKLGMCVGGQLQDQELLAPYPNNYWFSYPSSCPTKVWNDKTDACRAAQPGGLCPFGVEPDGIMCSFSYEILGWVKLDDVVGITKMKNPATNKTYVDYAEFCNAGGVEFQATIGSNSHVFVNQTIPFWKDPLNPKANTKRAQHLVSAYATALRRSSKTSGGGTMKPLPTITSLQKKNPPCYKNNVQCATAKFGCRRQLYSQICEVCKKNNGDCIRRPSGFKFPQL